VGGLFPLGFKTKILCEFLISPMCAACPAHLLLDLIWRRYELCSSSLYSFLQPLVTSSLFGPNILLNTLFSNTHNHFFFLNLRDQVLHPYTTTGKTFTLLNSRHENERF
jgi:hypothetical protein